MLFVSSRPYRSILTGLALFAGALFANKSTAQQKELYSYRDLSHKYYAAKKDSLKKNWTCPAVYKEKATQKKYKEYWEDRTDYITGAMERRCFIYEKEVQAYIDGIVTELMRANPKLIPKKPLLLIDRSSAVNAYSTGSDVLIVNLGLVTFANTREELAFVLAHELSHNMLRHSDNFMKERAEWFTSDEYKESMSSVLDSKYGRYSRLMKIYEGYTFSRSRHSRYHEGEADSLAVVMLKSSNIAFDPNFLLRLDSVDVQYKQPLKQPVKNYFASYNLPFDDWWVQKKSKGLSTRAYNFKDTTGIEDSLKTHPDCKLRYATVKKQGSMDKNWTSIPSAIHSKASRILIWNLFDDNMLTTCLYRVFMEKDKGNTDVWYNFMMHNVLGGLVYADNRLNRFNAVGVLKKEYISKDYYELQNMLEQMPKEPMEQYYNASRKAAFWSQMSEDAVAFKQLLHDVIKETDDKELSAALKTFSGKHGSSMYNEFTDHFTNK
ncbi:MAG: peptidase M48 Ste24p [Sphingobacteriales bacterium]|nr:MAG: peptidase M48 Ste24p [Sphingobacteriales bacterium]